MRKAGRASGWVPDRQAAGTELMVAGLRQRLGRELERVNLKVMGFDTLDHDGDSRPQVVWMHHDVNQEWVQWCKDKTLVDLVDCFVFVSCWQREQYLKAFGLPPERCVVLRNATEVGSSPRRWEPAPVWRCAYTSTPFRGLSVLLDAWERVGPSNAELHIWSSMKLYLGDDGPYNHLYERAQSMPGVIYHGIVPNPELCAALRDMHFLVYPSTFAETSCLAVIEAMAAGCRVIIPSLGALPETTGGYARIYPHEVDANRHAEVFANVLAYEMSNPWAGATDLSMAQQQYCAETFDWDHRAAGMATAHCRAVRRYRTRVQLGCACRGIVSGGDDNSRRRQLARRGGGGGGFAECRSRDGRVELSVQWRWAEQPEVGVVRSVPEGVARWTATGDIARPASVRPPFVRSVQLWPDHLQRSAAARSTASLCRAARHRDPRPAATRRRGRLGLFSRSDELHSARRATGRPDAGELRLRFFPVPRAGGRTRGPGATRHRCGIRPPRHPARAAAADRDGLGRSRCSPAGSGDRSGGR